MKPDPAPTLFVLYVRFVSTSRNFYCNLLALELIVSEPGMVIFRLDSGVELGLMAETAIQSLLPDMPDPRPDREIARCELYLRLRGADAAFQRGKDAGARELSPMALRDWGERAGYLLDPDGHVIACADLPGPL